MGKIEDTVWKLAEPIASEQGLELIDVEYVKEGSEWYLRLFLDKDADGGVDLNDCERMSRSLSDVLEVADPVPQAYHLEVSSPGIERPLKRMKDFLRFRGEKVEIRTFAEVAGRKQFVGILGETTEDSVSLEVDGAEVRIPRALISKANLVWDF